METPEGIYSVTIKWADDKEDIFAVNLKSLDDCLKVLRKYLGYESFVIELVPFNSPDRY